MVKSPANLFFLMSVNNGEVLLIESNETLKVGESNGILGAVGAPIFVMDTSFLYYISVKYVYVKPIILLFLRSNFIK